MRSFLRKRPSQPPTPLLSQLGNRVLRELRVFGRIVRGNPHDLAVRGRVGGKGVHGHGLLLLLLLQVGRPWPRLGRLAPSDEAGQAPDPAPLGAAPPLDRPRLARLLLRHPLLEAAGELGEEQVQEHDADKDDDNDDDDDGNVGHEAAGVGPALAEDTVLVGVSLIPAVDSAVAKQVPLDALARSRAGHVKLAVPVGAALLEGRHDQGERLVHPGLPGDLKPHVHLLVPLLGPEPLAEGRVAVVDISVPVLLQMVVEL